MFEGCLILGQGMDRLGATEIIVTTCLSAREVEMAAVLVSKVFKVGGRHEILLRKVLKYCTLCGKQLVHKKSEFASINQHKTWFLCLTNNNNSALQGHPLC